MGEWLRPEVWRPLLALGLVAAAVAAAGIWFLWKKGKLRAVSGEVVRYLVIGVLTTVVSIASYALLTEALSVHYLVSNLLSWMAAVVFAYFTNRSFVFRAEGGGRQFLLFAASRLLTLGLEYSGLLLLVEKLAVHEVIAKVVMQAVVIVANYVLSKWAVFRKGRQE